MVLTKSLKKKVLVAISGMVLEQLDIHIQKKKKESRHRPYTLSPFTNVKWKIIKLLEDNIQEIPDDIRHSNDFFVKPRKVWSMKEIIDKLNFIQIKNFCSVKDSVKTMRGMGENVCKRYIW